jgi:hypothetical protein
MQSFVLNGENLFVFQVYMYQAACRMMAEANPVKTQRLLQKSVMRQRSANEEKSKYTPANHCLALFIYWYCSQNNLNLQCQNAY